VACALLVANNLRDIPTDTLVGKRTLAVRLGGVRTRRLYVALLAVPFAVAVGLAVATTPWVLLGLGALPLAVRAGRPVVAGAVGPGLIPTLQATGLTELTYAALVAVGLWIG